jgi:hypothetical protein
LTVGGGQSSYDFDGLPAPGSSQPWCQADEQRLAATFRFRVSETASGFLIPSVRENRAPDAASGDHRTWGLYAAA